MAIEINFHVKVSWEELRTLSPEQCEAFMRGVAACISANPNTPAREALETDRQMKRSS